MIETRMLKDVYADYKKETIGKTVGRTVYMRTVSGFMQFLILKVLEGFIVKLGRANTLGSLSIIGKKPQVFTNEDGSITGLPINWKETHKLWKEDPVAAEKGQKVFLFNEHTNGIRYSFYWNKKFMKVHNHQYYCFKVSRANRKLLSDHIRGGKEYIVKIQKQHYGSNNNP